MIDDQYERLLKDVLLHGEPRQDRTGVGTRAVFGRQLRYDLSRGFPRITTKYIPMKVVKAELLWFLRGEDDIDWLQEQDVHIWDDWVRLSEQYDRARQDSSQFTPLALSEINGWAVRENKAPIASGPRCLR